MAYEMVMPYHLHMPSYFLETFTEYPYNRLLQLHPEILKRAPLVYIASLLQMTPETLSRVRSSLL